MFDTKSRSITSLIISLLPRTAPLRPLLRAVVAGLAQRLKRTSPEASLITMVRLDVVAHELTRSHLDALAQLACEHVAHEHIHAQLLPPRRLVPLAPAALITLPIERLAIDRRACKPRPQAAETWPQTGQLRHMDGPETTTGGVTEATPPVEERKSPCRVRRPNPVCR